MGALPDETEIDVLTSLRNYSLPEFVKLFDFLLQQVKTKVLENDAHEDRTLEQVMIILSKAADAYYSL